MMNWEYQTFFYQKKKKIDFIICWILSTMRKSIFKCHTKYMQGV